MEAQAAAEMLEGKFAAYHRADWEHWISCYAQDAEVFYNTASKPMSPQEAAEMHAATVEFWDTSAYTEAYRRATEAAG